MRKVRFILILAFKALNRYKWQVLGGSILLILISWTSWQGIQFLLNKKPRISQGVVGVYTEKDLPPLITHLLSQGLTTIDNSGLPQKGIADSWETSEDGKTYLFKIDKEKKWIDGSEIRAEDIEINIPDVQVQVKDSHTLEFKLSDSYSPFPTLLTKPLFKKGTKIGTGPYKILSITKEGAIVKKITLTSPNPNLPDLVIRVYRDEKIAKQALRIGEVQSLLGLNEIEDLEINDPKGPFTFQEIPNFSKVVTIFYNTQDPVLSDINLRVALSYAAPSIPGEIKAQSPLSPNSWAFNPDTRIYLDKLDQAKEYLKKVENRQNLEIILTTLQPFKSVGERVINSWEKLGIKAKLQIESGMPQQFQALLISQPIPSDPDQYSLWHKLGQKNITKYSFPRIDKDLEDGRKAMDLNKRKEAYHDFQKVLLEHAPATFLYYPKYKVVYLKKVEDELKKVLQYQLEAF